MAGAWKNYGSTSDGSRSSDVRFAGPRRSGFEEGEYSHLCETIASNIFTIQSGGTNVEKALKAIGTKRDTQGLRDNVHVIQMSTNQVVTQTSQDLVRLGVITKNGNRLQKLQLEKLKSEFKAALQQYSTVQKEIAQRMKATLPMGTSSLAWGENEETADRQKLLEEAAEERHHKQQILKEAEFEREMLLEREKRVHQIESDILDVNEIMKQLASMVQEQGETLNSIENNIDRTYTAVEEGREQLQKAASSQRTHRRCLCLLAGIAATVTAVIAIVLYFELRSSS